MLTVIREMAEEAERRDVRTLPKDELLEHVVARGEDALARTPELLEVLQEAGVVDAGGAGLLELVRGPLRRRVRQGPARDGDGGSGREIGFEALHQELSRYRYCTAFVVEGNGLDAEELERELEPLGDSLLVVGDSSALKVHVHTDEPGAALRARDDARHDRRVEIANMHRQTVERERRLEASLAGVPTLETGVVAVVPGEGNRRLFESYGATRVIEGGQTMNPSTAEIVAAVAGDAGRRGDRAPEQLQRPAHCRAGGRPCRQARARRARPIPCPRGWPRSCATSRRARPRRTSGRCAKRSTRSSRARSRPPRATWSSTECRCGKAPGSAWPTALQSRAPTTSTTWPARSSSGCSTAAARSSRS